jgi:hypothetical protein
VYVVLSSTPSATKFVSPLVQSGLLYHALGIDWSDALVARICSIYLNVVEHMDSLMPQVVWSLQYLLAPHYYLAP